MRIQPVTSAGPLLTLAILLNFHTPGHGEDVQIRFTSIRIDTTALKVNVEFEHLLDHQVLQGMRRGMTAMLIYRAQVWKKRPLWLKTLVIERHRRFKIHFDNWEHRFILTPREGAPKTLSEEDLKSRCNILHDFHLVEPARLDSGAVYRILISVEIRPMSVENMEEIKHWLKGEANEFNPEEIRIGKSFHTKAADWLLGLMVNLTGFGDRMHSEKSPRFSIINDRVLIREKD